MHVHYQGAFIDNSSAYIHTWIFSRRSKTCPPRLYIEYEYIYTHWYVNIAAHVVFHYWLNWFTSLDSEESKGQARDSRTCLCRLERTRPRLVINPTIQLNVHTVEGCSILGDSKLTSEPVVQMLKQRAKLKSCDVSGRLKDIYAVHQKEVRYLPLLNSLLTLRLLHYSSARRARQPDLPSIDAPQAEPPPPFCTSMFV